MERNNFAAQPKGLVPNSFSGPLPVQKGPEKKRTAGTAPEQMVPGSALRLAVC
jgi:hypothetical protein